MTNKQRTIKACKELEKKYLDPYGKKFFKFTVCPLCDVHGRLSLWLFLTCRGCPLANESGGCGCLDFRSFRIAEYSINRESESIESKSITEENDSMFSGVWKKAFKCRSNFFKRIIPILEQIPVERFTKKGWKYFKELDREW